MSISKGVLKEVASYQSSSKVMKEKIKKVEQGYFTVDSILHDHRIEYRKNKESVQERLNEIELGYQSEVEKLRNNLRSAANVRLFQENRIVELDHNLRRLTEYVSKLWTAVSVLSGIVAVILLYFVWYLYYGI